MNYSIGKVRKHRGGAFGISLVILSLDVRATKYAHPKYTPKGYGYSLNILLCSMLNEYYQISKYYFALVNEWPDKLRRQEGYALRQ